eukprot:363863-Chlamydomonas_euryale.AAC.8
MLATAPEGIVVTVRQSRLCKGMISSACSPAAMAGRSLPFAPREIQPWLHRLRCEGRKTCILPQTDLCAAATGCKSNSFTPGLAQQLLCFTSGLQRWPFLLLLTFINLKGRFDEASPNRLNAVAIANDHEALAIAWLQSLDGSRIQSNLRAQRHVPWGAACKTFACAITMAKRTP